MKFSSNMKVVRNILCLLIIGFLFGCSGDSTKSVSDNTSTVIGSEPSEDGKVKLQKLEGSEIVISNASSDQQNPHVIYLPDKNLWFSVYEDWSNSLATGADIKGKFVDSNGNICGSELTITNVSGNQTAPWATYRDREALQVPYTGTGNDTIMVVWQDTRGTTSSGYVYHKAINVTSINTTDCSGYAIGAENAISYNQIKENDVTVSSSTTTTADSKSLGFGNGSTTGFTGTLTTPVVSGSVTVTAGAVTLTDDGNGGLSAGANGYGTIDYATGDLSITLAAAPAFGTLVSASYQYTTTTVTVTPSLLSVGDTLLSRKSPRVAYDPVRDSFRVVWNESRSTLNRISELCFGFAPTAWQFGDTTFPGYVALDGATLTEQPSKIGVSGADIIRNAETRTNRLIDTPTWTTFTRIYEYEYFTDANNITAASDTTSPEDFMVWEGARQKGVLTCNCTDKNGNSVCDYGDCVTSTFETSSYDDGLVHIYGLFDKEIPQSVINSKRLDTTNTSTAYYPTVAFDPITKRFLTAWEDMRDTLTKKIWGQLVYSGGGLYNINFLISYQDTDGDGSQDSNIANSKQTKPFISYDSVNQRYFVIWQDGRNGSVSLENLDVYGQYVDAEGSLRGSNYSISTAAANQYNPTIAYNSQNNQFLAVWKDARNYTTTASDVYGQRFSLGQPQLTLLKTDNTPLSPALLDFGGITANESSTMSFKIKNTGDITLNIDCINPMPATPFSFDNLPTQLNSCDGSVLSLVPSGEITLTVRFSPTSSGTFISSFTINSDAGNRTVNLQGVGGSIGITIQEGDGTNDGTLNFGSIKAGESKSLSFTVTNTGAIKFSVVIVVNPYPPFSGSTSLWSYLDPGESHTFTVEFHPYERGNYTGQVLINTDNPTLNRVLILQGTGTAPVLMVSPTSKDFGAINVGSNSDQTITIYNDGDATLNITTCGSFSPPFNLISSCPASIASGGNQDITIRFSPSDVVSYSSNITITTDAGDQTVSLSGQGAGGKISLSPEQIDFGAVPTGSPETVTLTVTNTGNASMNITGITAPSSPFSVSYTGTPPIQLLPNTSFTILVKFSPTTANNYSSSFVIQTNAINGNKTVNLQGVGVAPDISITPSPITFTNTAVGQSQSMNLAIKNNGTLTVAINDFDEPDAPFSITGLPSTPYSLAAGSTLNLVVKFSPETAGSFSSSLDILFDYAMTPTIVNITGNGTSGAQAGNVVFLQDGSQITSVAFGNIFKGSPSKKTLSVKNNGSNAITINDVSISSTAFVTTLPEPFTLNAGGTKTFDVTFTPSSVTSYSATLTLTDASGSSYQLSLTGAGSSVDVKSSAGTVSYFTALTSSQLPTSAKPGDFNTSKAAEFVIEGITPNSTVTVTVTFESLPSNPVFYKVVGNTWTPLTNYTLNGNAITYSITDNGAMDNDSTPGVIKDPIIVGSTGAGGGGSISSSGGGCSIGGHQNAPTAFADMAVMLMPLFVIIMLRIRHKKK